MVKSRVGYSGSGVGRRVKDNVKEVEDYLKTYSSPGMDISWRIFHNLLILEGSYVTNVPPFDVDNFSSYKDSDLDVEEDTRSSGEFLSDLNDEGKYKAIKVELALLTKKIDVVSKNKSEKGLVAESFDWGEESLSSKDEGVTRVKAFMAIAEDELVVGKTDTRSDLYSVEDQRKNFLNKFNSLKQELSLCKSELIDLKNTKGHNISLQNEITRLNLDNESLRDEVSDLKKVKEVKRRKQSTQWKLCSPKGLSPLVHQTNVIPPADLVQTSKVFDKTKKVTEKESSVKATKKKAQTKSPSILDPSHDKKPDSSTEQLLLTLMQEATYSRKALKIPKPFIPYKYFRFNDHHSDECEYYPRCDICGSISHEPSDCDKKTLPSNRKPRIAT
ncbi:hypothetical protein Tco_0538644 [Tanacetum coccineum]